MSIFLGLLKHLKQRLFVFGDSVSSFIDPNVETFRQKIDPLLQRKWVSIHT